MKVPKLVQKWADQSLVVFTCQYSAHRAPQCANWYRQKANPRQRVAILSGGFRGWEALGLPVQSLAAPDAAHAADETAKLLGSQFAGGCVTRVPGGGFSIPGQWWQPPVANGTHLCSAEKQMPVSALYF